MIAVDTNLLVYAHRSDSTWHTRSAAAVKALSTGVRPWAIPWPAVHEFLGIVTHPRIYAPPSTMKQACAQVDAWLESPTLMLLGEASDYWPALRALVNEGRVAGARVHDTHIAALCALHGVAELWTADRDFSRFPTLVTKNPLLSAD